MKKLFKSQTSFEIIDLLIKNKDKKFYLAEISRKLQKDIANTTRELTNLVKEGIVRIADQNGKKYYFFNAQSKTSPELEKLFNKLNHSDLEKKFKTKWLLAEDIPNLDPFFSQLWLNCFVDEFKEPGGKAYKKTTSIFKDYHLWFYFDERDACEVGEHLVNKFEENPDFMHQINEKINEYSDKLRDYVSTLPETGLDKFSNQELWDFFKTHEDIHTEYYQWGWIPVAADMFCNNLSNRGKKILKEQLKVQENKIDEYLAILTLPTKPSLLKIEQDNLMKIGIKVQKDKKQYELFKELFRKFKAEDVKFFGLYTHSIEYEKKLEEKVKELEKNIKPDIMKDLQEHYANYFYTNFLFTEEIGVYSFEYYLKELVRLVSSDDNLEKTFNDEQQKVKSLIAEREELIEKLELDQKLMKFFDGWGDFMVTKIYRRYAQLLAIYRMVAVLEEIGKRIGLTLKQTKFMTTEETEKALLQDIYDLEEIKKRVEFSVYYAEGKDHQRHCKDC